jgi:hypothetical protein
MSDEVLNLDVRLSDQIQLAKQESKQASEASKKQDEEAGKTGEWYHYYSPGKRAPFQSPLALA